MYLQGNVIDPSSTGTADGAFPIVNMGRANEALVAELHGKYFTHCYRGNVYYASTATGGVVIPIATTLTPTYSLWNPAGSGKLLVPIVTLIAWTATVGALGGIIWTYTTGAGAGVATAAPFSAFGSGTPVNANVGSAKASAMKTATGGTTTLTAAASYYRTTGITTLVDTAAIATAGFFTMRDDWDGAGMVAPGNAIHLMGNASVAITAVITTAYVEVPI